MRDAGRILAETLQLLVERVAARARREGAGRNRPPGIQEAETSRPRSSATPNPPYPATICVSVNDEIVHGIPGDREIMDGDIVSIDIGCTHKGFVADMAVTVGVGNVRRKRSDSSMSLEEALRRGIGAARGGARVGDIGAAIQTYVEGEGFSVVREYVGHGVGRQMHEDPQIPNYGSPEYRRPCCARAW